MSKSNCHRCGKLTPVINPHFTQNKGGKVKMYEWCFECRHLHKKPMFTTKQKIGAVVIIGSALLSAAYLEGYLLALGV